MHLRLAQILQDVEVVDAYRARVGDQFLLADTSQTDWQSNGTATSTTNSRELAPIVKNLRDTLYVKYYCAIPVTESARLERFDSDESMSATEAETDSLSDPRERFLSGLRSANSRAECWLPGWTAHGQTPDGRLTLFAGELVVHAWPTDVRMSASSNQNQAGGIELRAKTEEISTATGFYFAYGVTPADSLLQCSTTRIYFNLSAAGAARWVRLLTTTLDQCLVPFTLKCLLDPQQYRRSDAAVLYIPRAYARYVWHVLQEPIAQLEDVLRSTTPMFALPVRPGVAVADDPGNGESFGQHRMRLVAQALYLLSQNYPGSQESEVAKVERWTEFRKQLSMEGLDIERAYVNASCIDLVTRFEL